MFFGFLLPVRVLRQLECAAEQHSGSVVSGESMLSAGGFTLTADAILSHCESHAEEHEPEHRSYSSRQYQVEHCVRTGRRLSGSGGVAVRSKVLDRGCSR
jgi:hypothetical protein